MKWTSTLLIVLLPSFFVAAFDRESRAAPPKSASKLPAQDRSLPPNANQETPPAPDANAATRKAAPRTEQTAPPETPPSAAASPLDRGGEGNPSGAETPDDRLLSDEDAAIPTQEEADREAEQAITEENADQELEKLEKELEGGG